MIQSDIPHTAIPENPAMKSGKGKKAAKRIASVSGILILLFGISLFVAFPKADRFVVELGEEPSVSPTDYLLGYGFIVNYGKIDVTGVDTDKVGDYRATASLLFYNYRVDISVVDTTPPEIIPFDEELYIATGREYKPEDFASEISDISHEVNCRIRYGGDELEGISFPAAGEYRILLEAEDPSGNVGSSEISFTVDDPPVIIGVFDRHLPVGTDFDITRAAAADTGDGNLTGSIKVDRGDFDPQKEGNYTVSYSVSDSHGLLTEKSVILSICGKKTLSLYHDDISLTVEELNLLCDAEYFTYQPLETPDYDAAVELIEPTLLDLKHKIGSYGYAAGSGCVYRVTPEYIYMLSVNHVLKSVNNDCDIMFFDGTVVRQNLDYISSRQKNELSIFRIPSADVPVDTLLKLKQIYVDPDIYSKLARAMR